MPRGTRNNQRQTKEQIEAQPQERGEERKPERIPLNQQKGRLKANFIREGYHGCFVNDTENGSNIQKYLSAGYTFCEDPNVQIETGHSTNSGTQVDSRHCIDVGGGIKAYLMEIPQEFYDADMEQEEQARLEKERSQHAHAKQELGGYGEEVREQRHIRAS